MKKDLPLSQESFDKLLAWLHPDREQAGEKYEEIRAALIRRLLHLGYSTPEDLVDETINHVAQNIDAIVSTDVGDPVLYFCAVLRTPRRWLSQRKPAHESKLPRYPQAHAFRANAALQ